ncbi:hypothetical protein JTE90_019835 [Oedothorax gibbosus]|uniref:Uncharacterized protein n=1 Tax=Oedothorax gibbosus TaxID=931172 RepID=A0AAV6V6Q8_9ARAC|nr:hypothetical protein JTE90_019835 [Oedothorax gibbosus]
MDLLKKSVKKIGKYSTKIISSDLLRLKYPHKIASTHQTPPTGARSDILIKTSLPPRPQPSLPLARLHVEGVANRHREHRHPTIARSHSTTQPGANWSTNKLGQKSCLLSFFEILL